MKMKHPQQVQAKVTSNLTLELLLVLGCKHFFGKKLSNLAEQPYGSSWKPFILMPDASECARGYRGHTEISDTCRRV